VAGGGKGVGGGEGDDLAGQEPVLVGVPEEAWLPVVGLLEMLVKSFCRIPRSSKAYLDKNKVEIVSDM
jgi:hypothetical protein